MSSTVSGVAIFTSKSYVPPDTSWKECSRSLVQPRSSARTADIPGRGLLRVDARALLHLDLEPPHPHRRRRSPRRTPSRCRKVPVPAVEEVGAAGRVGAAPPRGRTGRAEPDGAAAGEPGRPSGTGSPPGSPSPPGPPPVRRLRRPVTGRRRPAGPVDTTAAPVSSGTAGVRRRRRRREERRCEGRAGGAADSRLFFGDGHDGGCSRGVRGLPRLAAQEKRAEESASLTRSMSPGSAEARQAYAATVLSGWPGQRLPPAEERRVRPVPGRPRSAVTAVRAAVFRGPVVGLPAPQHQGAVLREPGHRQAQLGAVEGLLDGVAAGAAAGGGRPGEPTRPDAALSGVARSRCARRRARRLVRRRARQDVPLAPPVRPCRPRGAAPAPASRRGTDTRRRMPPDTSGSSSTFRGVAVRSGAGVVAGVVEPGSADRPSRRPVARDTAPAISATTTGAATTAVRRLRARTTRCRTRSMRSSGAVSDGVSASASRRSPAAARVSSSVPYPLGPPCIATVLTSLRRGAAADRLRGGHETGIEPG